MGTIKSSHARIGDYIADIENLMIGSEAYEETTIALWDLLSSGHKDVLKQILYKPTYDGDIASKSSRDDLLEWGLAIRCCFNFEQGYTTATYLASAIWNEVGRIYANP